MEVFIAIILGIILFYPVKVLVRWLIGFFEYSNTLQSWITFATLTIIYLIFITQTSGQWGAVLTGLMAAIPCFLIYLMIDLQKGRQHSKVVSFLQHIATRIVVSLLSFIVLITFYQQQFDKYGIDDHLFIKSFLIYIIYVCVIMRRRKKKIRLVKSTNENLNSLKR